MMEDEVVRKRKWMDAQHFLDLIGATNLIPGSNSTEMTLHCGYELFLESANIASVAVMLSVLIHLAGEDTIAMAKYFDCRPGSLF